MTRRSENSGLIDLDALMREATAREAAEPPPSAPVVEAPRTSSAEMPRPPAAVVEAAPRPPAPPSSTAEVARAVLQASVAQTPVAQATVQAPVVQVVARVDVPPPPKSGVIAKDVLAPPSTPSTPTAVSDVPAPPSSTKVTDDSLEAVSCEPRTDPWIPSASSSTQMTPASASIPPPAASPPASRGYGKAIAAGLALALVAGGLVFLRPRGASVDSSTAAASTNVSTPLDAPKAATAPPPAESPGVAALSADDLPSAAAPSTRTTTPTHAAPSPARQRAVDPDKPTVLTEASLAPSSDQHGDLGSAMRGAVGANDKAAAVTNDGPSGPSASQLHPSQGALVGAIGAVLPTARACLGPDDTVRNGLVIFKSDGTVARVDIRGSKPEDECIRDALAKAKVSPFVDDTFSTRVTVRP